MSKWKYVTRVLKTLIKIKIDVEISTIGSSEKSISD